MRGGEGDVLAGGRSDHSPQPDGESNILIEAWLTPLSVNPLPCIWNTCGFDLNAQMVGSLTQISNGALFA
jgi:hypothetical protein